MVTFDSVAVPQFVTPPETWNEPAESGTVCGPQNLPTWMQAVLVTMVTHVAQVADAGPHGPVPVAVKKSLTVPQRVSGMLCGGTGAAV